MIDILSNKSLIKLNKQIICLAKIFWNMNLLYKLF